MLTNLITNSFKKGPEKTNVYLDPNDKIIIKNIFNVPVWLTGTVYYENDFVKPVTNNGFYYKCIRNGLSSTTPNWNNIDDYGQVFDGSIIWKEQPIDFWLTGSEIINASTWISENGIVLSNQTFSSISSEVTIDSIDPFLESFILTNQVTKSNGEKLSRSFIYKVNQQ